jgi:hypothetical protein
MMLNVWSGSMATDVQASRLRLTSHEANEGFATPSERDALHAELLDHRVQRRRGAVIDEQQASPAIAHHRRELLRRRRRRQRAGGRADA